MARNFFAILIVALFAGILTKPLLAYPTPVDFDGRLLRWNVKAGDGPIIYEVLADDDSIRDEYSSAIDDSADLWNNVDSSYLRLEPVTPGQTAHITVRLKSSINGGEHSAGYSTFDVYDSNGPTHCEIYIAVDATTAYVPFAKTALHEMGHCLGLGHSLIPEAIMSYDLDKNSFGLDVDDRAAVSRLYPADGSSPKLPPGCSVGRVARSSDGRQDAESPLSRAIVMVLLLLLPAFAALWPLKKDLFHASGTTA